MFTCAVERVLPRTGINLESCTHKERERAPTCLRIMQLAVCRSRESGKRRTGKLGIIRAHEGFHASTEFGLRDEVVLPTDPHITRPQVVVPLAVFPARAS